MTLQATSNILTLILQNVNSLLNDKNTSISIHDNEIHNHIKLIVILINSIHSIATLFIIHCFLNHVDQMFTCSFYLLKVFVI